MGMSNILLTIVKLFVDIEAKVAQCFTMLHREARRRYGDTQRKAL